MIPPALSTCVAFLACRRSSEEDGQRFFGTCFFLLYPHPKGPENVGVIYAITARHVIESIKKFTTDWCVYIRFDMKGSGVRVISTGVNDWISDEDDPTIDVAVCPIELTPNWSVTNHIAISLRSLLTAEMISTLEIAPGDALFFPGLFREHYGTNSNVPILRMGNIAALPQEKVRTRIGKMHAYLLEARSIGGLSGSPVFVNLRARALKMLLKDTVADLLPTQFPVLGMIHGHYGTPDKPDDAASPDGVGEQSINMGIAIAVPAHAILATLNLPALAQLREGVFGRSWAMYEQIVNPPAWPQSTEGE